MSSSDKRKHKTIPVSAKAEIIKKLDIGEKLINLAKEYGVGHATIYDTRKNYYYYYYYLLKLQMGF
jgi:hypothetical protein